MRHTINLGIAALLLILASEPVSAGNNTVDVQPTKIEVASSAQTAAVTLTNNGTADKLYEATIYAWSQSQNKDELVPSRDVIVYPPVIPIAAGKSKVVRLGIKPLVGGGHERAYRLVFDEVPQKVNNPGGMVQFNFRFSVPVFIAPAAEAASSLNWSASLDANHRHLSLVLTNSGSTHIAAHNVSLYSDFAGTELLGTIDISNDVLAGTRTTYDFTLPQALRSNAVAGKLELNSGAVLRFAAPVSS